jgi:hypothetical protein
MHICIAYVVLRGRFNFTLDQGLLDGLRDAEVKRKLSTVRSASHFFQGIFLCGIGFFTSHADVITLITEHV